MSGDARHGQGAGGAGAPPVIAIDGPTASGKGTVAQRVADALGWHYLDSGALYRLTALCALRGGVALDAGDAVAALAASMMPVFRRGAILLDGDDVSDAIRAEAVGEAASKIAALPVVRAALVGLQHRARRAPGLVADGRDMGTVIFPDASLKVFLTATARARAERRHKQLIEKGFPANIDSLSRDLEARDARDMRREDAPLRPAEDALVIDSTLLTVEQTVAAVLEAYRRQGLS